MSFAIKHGLFKLNITDYHAILGVSLDADSKDIRLEYLKIAQKLHPDKCRSNANKMKIAGQILSKLVNPAYEQLSKKNNFAEHQLVLTQIGKRLAENKTKITIEGESAKELLKAGDSFELLYPKLLKQLSLEKYKSLEQTVNDIGILSELNLVYLMLKSERGINRQQKSSPSVANKQTVTQRNSTVIQGTAVPTQTSPTTSQTSSKIDEPTPESRISAFVSRAQQYIAKGEYEQAITELRDALRIDPNHAQAHAVTGLAYLHKRQLTMAKVHIGKACSAEPHNPIVVESKKALDKLTKTEQKSKTSNPNSNQKSDNNPGNSGFFSGFFGSKKK
ncbi:MAG: J domain-containing protein [Waterburya sp.]